MPERAEPAHSGRQSIASINAALGKCCGVDDAWLQPCANCPNRVPPATAEQAAEAMRLSVDRASIPPEVLGLIQDPDLSIPGDPLAPDDR